MHDMDINRAEIRRQLRDAQAEQDAAIPRFRDALHRIFGSPDIPTAAKAHLLGVPHRRQFLKIGGATILGAAVLVACGSDEEEGASETGVTTASTSSTTAPPQEGDGPETDIVLARTAASVENLAVLVYSVVLGESSTTLPAEITFDPAVVQAAELFRSHHEVHADALNDILEDAGEQAYTDPNPYLLENVVSPELKNLTDQTKVLRYARDLENIAAGTYAYAAGALSEPSLRQQLMSIGGVEARHATVLNMVLDPTGMTAVPASATDAGPEGRVPDEAVLTDDALEQAAEEDSEG